MPKIVRTVRTTIQLTEFLDQYGLELHLDQEGGGTWIASVPRLLVADHIDGGFFTVYGMSSDELRAITRLCENITGKRLAIDSGSFFTLNRKIDHTQVQVVSDYPSSRDGE